MRGILPVTFVTAGFVVTALMCDGQAAAYTRSTDRIREAIASFDREWESLRTTDWQEVDTHALAIAAERDPRGQVSLLSEIHRRICMGSGTGTNDSWLPLFAKEAHAGQLLLTLTTRLGTESLRPIACDPAHVLRPIDTERQKAAWGRAASWIRLSLADAVRQRQRMHPGDQDWKVSLARRQLINELSALDLSWFIQVLAIDFKAHSRPFSMRWVDTSGTVQSLPALIEAQLFYSRYDRENDAVDYSTESSVHTLAMLVLIDDNFANDPTASSYLTGYRTEARALYQELGGLLNARQSESRYSLSLLAHLVQTAFCRPERPGSPGESLIASGTGEKWGWRLTNAVVTGQSIHTSFVLQVHSYWALQGFLAWKEGRSPSLAVGRCASI